MSFARFALLFAALVAPGAAFIHRPQQPQKTAASAGEEGLRFPAVGAVVRDAKTGNIYIGEPDALDELGQALGDALDALLGGSSPQPVLVPIPIPLRPTREEN